MNKWFGIGRLTANPTTGTTQSGKKYCKFSIAINRFGSEEQRTDYFNITTWDKQADSCSKYLEKGKQVAVVGTIQTGKYEKNGVTFTTWDVRADNVEFLSPAEAAHKNTDVLTEIDDDDSDMPF